MKKAVDYEILRNVSSHCRAKIALARKPIMVCTLMDEAEFQKDKLLIHLKTVFFEDYIHDWNWENRIFRYYSRLADKSDVVVVYATEEAVLAPKYDCMTGEKLTKE